jgi:hypothetical protein
MQEVKVRLPGAATMAPLIGQTQKEILFALL